MVRYWAHNGLLRQGTTSGKIGGRGEREPSVAGDESTEQVVSGKMSRSKGAGGLADLIARQGGERIRFFLLRTHYRSTVLFNEPAIEEAGTGLETFYRLFKRYERVTGRSAYELPAPQLRRDARELTSDDPTLVAGAECREKFLAAMDDDFNTGGAIGELFELATLANKHCDQSRLEDGGRDSAEALATFTSLLTSIKELGGVLGLFLKPPVTPAAGDQLLGDVIGLVVELRAEARSRKDFATADAIREAIAAAGISLEDRAGGTDWSGGNADSLGALMNLVIDLRAKARKSKDFATADKVRDRLGELGIVLEDRAGGTEWSRM
jgi:cysteinyl-tRNA synthetase